MMMMICRARSNPQCIESLESSVTAPRGSHDTRGRGGRAVDAPRTEERTRQVHHHHRRGAVTARMVVMLVMP